MIQTFLLTPAQYRTLYSQAPQLIAMALKDMNEIPVESGDERGFGRMEMPLPSNEPWIGVIDTPFNEDVYFSDWVSAETTLPSEVFAPTRLPAWDLCVVDYCGRAVS